MRLTLPSFLALLILASMLATDSSSQSIERGPGLSASQTDSVTLRYLGAAGWEISAGSEASGDRVVVLVDPYLTRANFSGRPSQDPNERGIHLTGLALTDPAPRSVGR